MKVTLENISFGYDSKNKVLNDISFSINENETIAILGQSGCGKSTLLKIICGLLPNSKENYFTGTIDFDEDLKQMRTDGKIGYIFQEATLLPFMTVKENIELPLKILKNKDANCVKTLSEKVGLNNKLNDLPSELSGGMKTRVGIVRAFVTKPKIVLMDEPFSALDVFWKNKLCSEISTLKNESNSNIILVTHDIFEAIYFSNRIIILSTQGSIKSTITLENKEVNCTYHDIVSNYSQKYKEIKQIIENES
jgi:NitT/TauT family transport system ATP-binding protein